MNVFAFIAACDELFQRFNSISSRTEKGYEKTYIKAREMICDPKLTLDTVSFLRQHLIILHHEQKLDYIKYIPVLDSIRESIRYNSEWTSDKPSETDWFQLFSVIIQNRGELHFFNHTDSLMENNLHTFAKSYIRIKSIGVEFIERDYNFYISERSYKLIDDKIDKLARSYGSDYFLNTLAGLIGSTYNTVTGRFMEYRHLSMGISTVHAAIPFGYLVAIASKFIGTNGSGDKESFNNLLLLITDLIVIFEIQPYSVFEAMHLDSGSFLKFIINNILYDGFVGIAQTNGSYASALISFIQEQFSDSDYISHGVKLKDITRTAVAIIALAKTKQFHKLHIKQIAQKAKISEVKALAAMEKLLSISAGNTNSGLRFPPSSLDIDHYFKPAINNNNDYVIFPKSIAALGCLNTVLHSIAYPNGKWNNPLDSKLGYAIEDFLRNEFTKKGISFVNGDRVNGKPDLEVDLICETSDCIYIFEMKKKGLTRHAQSGNDCHILADLADSVLATHVQAMRIENALKNNKELTLIHHGVEYSVCLNDRRVLRISVSLHDFGAMQDKTILQKTLTIATQSSMKHHDPSEDRKLNNWRKHSRELERLAIENGEIGDAQRIPFHASLFMSIPQIIMILGNSDGSDKFFKQINHLVSMTTGSRDLYTEYLQVKRLVG